NYTIDTNGSINTVTFFDQSTPAGSIDSWTWDFGDGTTSSEQNPVHTYNETGTFNVCLTITTDSNTCNSTNCQDVIIQGGSTGDCEADFIFLRDSVDYYTIEFFDNSTSNLPIYSWFWDFDDGTTSTLQNPVHSFNDLGIFNVCLTIESGDSSNYCTDTYCLEIEITSGGGNDCYADFYYVTDSIGGATTVVNFFDLSTPAGSIDSWTWSFGDGSTSSEQNPVHNYASAGTYNVCLNIESFIQGTVCTDTYCMDIAVTSGGNDNLYLGGNVFADIYQLDHGFAYAYIEENGIITDVFSQVFDSLGYYLFYPMTEADYYVKAEPSPSSAYSGTHMPTYYGDVATWDDAVLINLDEDVFNADINLIPISQPLAGPGAIAGKITYSVTDAGNTPAVDIQIMLANALGEFVGLGYSDEEGIFEFPSLAYGTYTLYAEVTGIDMTPKDFTLSEGNAAINDISMIMNDEEIYFGPQSIKSLYIDNISNIYPNPIVNGLKMDVGVKNPTTLTVKIYNQMGQTLILEQFQLSNSKTIEINTSTLGSGFYFVEIIAEDNYRVARKFIK
ncbi:MAG: PKD domain-containing protein, partial [Bacteroidota bacterium]